MNILLVEDDLELGNGVRIALTDQGYRVNWVRRLSDATRHLAADLVDVLVLDRGLPDGDGLTLVGHHRRDGQSMPTLVITARDDLDDRVDGLDRGADDYLVKPFALAELFSRIRALTRRSYGLEGATLELRGLCLNEATMRTRVGGTTAELSRSEFLLLCALIKRPDRVLTRRTLEEQVLPGGARNESNVLDVHISNLRKKIGDGYIRTVRGVGYVIDRQAPATSTRGVENP